MAADNLDGFAALEGEQGRARQALRAFHEAVGGTQKDTGAQLGASQGLVSMWLSGREPIPQHQVERLLGGEIKPIPVEPSSKKRPGRPPIDRDPDRQEVARADLSDFVRAAGSAIGAAMLLGASKTTVSNWMSGRRPIPEWVEEILGSARNPSTDEIDPKAMAQRRKDASERALQAARDRAIDHSKNWSAVAEELATQFIGLPEVPPGGSVALRRIIKLVWLSLGTQEIAIEWLGLKHTSQLSRIVNGRESAPVRTAKLAVQWFEKFLEDH